MKNLKFLLFIICLVFFLNVIFFNCSFATLYIVKDQEGNNICMTNKEDLVSEYEKFGYAIWILKAGGLTQKSPEPHIFSNESQSQLKPESIDLEPQTKAVLPSTTELIPAEKTNVERNKMIDIFKANAWSNKNLILKSPCYQFGAKTHMSHIILAQNPNSCHNFLVYNFFHQNLHVVI